MYPNSLTKKAQSRIKLRISFHIEEGTNNARYTEKMTDHAYDLYDDWVLPITIKVSVTELRTAFPDTHFTIDAMMAEGDNVVVPQTFTGTHQGEFSGTPATGNKVTWTGIFIYRIHDGKIVERWGAFDTLGFMIQIGAVPPPGEGGK